jgi:hypothetical protein
VGEGVVATLMVASAEDADADDVGVALDTVVDPPVAW